VHHESGHRGPINDHIPISIDNDGPMFDDNLMKNSIIVA